MQFTKILGSGALAMLLSCASVVTLPTRLAAQVTQPTAAQTLERGYRTGYSDGYQAGYADSADASPRDFESKEDYRNADRTHVASYGAREIFRNGYQQGYEAGYDTGYERRPFDSTVPANLSRRDAPVGNAGEFPNAPARDAGRNDDDDERTVRDNGSNNSNKPSLVISRNTTMLVRLETNVSTDASQPGDRIQARVVEPSDFEDAMLHGVVRGVRRPGKVRGSAWLQIAFGQIQLPDGRWTELEAQVVEVVDTFEDNVGKVDEEGGIRGKDSTKGDVAKVGAGAAIGAIIGAIAGGGKGAAIGAGVGGAAGTGGVLASRGDDLRLLRGDQLRVRTARTVELR